jgi:uncharacterized protein (DUF427 family)
MKAIVGQHVIAESEDVIECAGYWYFPPQTVRTEWLAKTPRTEKDRACPHSVQFYDVVIEGERHPRNAWVYEAPRPEMARVGGRFGFWEDVQVG